MKPKGFTLIETLVAVLMIGILSAIAGPSWLSFANQQRVNAANDEIMRSLRTAQSEAKKTKLSYSVSFRVQNQAPQVAIYRARDAGGNIVDPNASSFTGWETLGEGLKPGQVLLGTNLSSENTASSTMTYASATAQKITFNYMGTLQPAPSLGANNQGLIVAAAVPQSASSDQPAATTRRCSKVMTLLGAIALGRGDACSAQ